MFLRLSDSFMGTLESMSSMVAKYLLENHEFYFANFLTLRKEDGEVWLTYMPNGKEQEFAENGDWKRKNRQMGKPGKIVRKIIGDGVFSDHDYELFSNEICGKNKEVEFHFSDDINDIKFAYLEDNYLYPNSGNLGKSCMRYDKCQDYLEFYEAIGAKILYATQYDKVVARAIVWPLDDGLLIDRIYGYDDMIRYAMLDYAKDYLNVIGYKTKDSYNDPDDITWVDEVNRSTEIKFYVGRDFDSSDWFPYMDTFKWHQDGFLLNHKPDSGCYVIMEDCDGGCDEYLVYRCDCCGCEIDEDECVNIGGDYYCRDCVVEDFFTNEWIVKDEAYKFYINEHGTVAYTDCFNMITEIDGDYYNDDIVILDELTGEHILNSDVIYYYDENDIAHCTHVKNEEILFPYGCYLYDPDSIVYDYFSEERIPKAEAYEFITRENKIDYTVEYDEIFFDESDKKYHEISTEKEECLIQ